MAQALVTFLATAGVGGTVPQRLFYAVTFSGADVPEELAIGAQIQIEVVLPYDYGLADMKLGLRNAVQAKADELGLTLVPADIYVQSYEVG